MIETQIVDNHLASELGNKLMELGESRNVYQIIKAATRYNDNSESLLYLIFCDDPYHKKRTQE